MYIDKKKFKSLKVLDGAKFEIDTNSVFGKWLRDTVNDLEKATHGQVLNALLVKKLPEMKNNLFTVSDPIARMAFENEKRLTDTILNEGFGSTCGAYIAKTGELYLYFIEEVTEEQRNRFEEEQCNWLAVIVMIGKDGKILNAAFASSRLDHEHDGKRRIIYDTPYMDTEIDYMCFSTLLVILGFLKYADTEKVYVENGQTKSLTKGESVKNSSGYKVKYYDSRWVREIIRTEGFSVRGHFRLQPVKDGKKLIYINEYQKHGYHRRAMKE